jgi:hypothetical protein
MNSLANRFFGPRENSAMALALLNIPKRLVDFEECVLMLIADADGHRAK